MAEDVVYALGRRLNDPDDLAAAGLISKISESVQEDVKDATLGDPKSLLDNEKEKI